MTVVGWLVVVFCSLLLCVVVSFVSVCFFLFVRCCCSLFVVWCFRCVPFMFFVFVVCICALRWRVAVYGL